MGAFPVKMGGRSKNGNGGTHMDYNEVLQRARARMAPRCKVCPECNGLGCGNTMPGPGSKAPGNGAIMLPLIVLSSHDH